MGIRIGAATLGLAMVMACGVAESAVRLVHAGTDLVRHNYFRLSPQPSVVDNDGTLRVFARNSGVVERHQVDGMWVEETVDPYVAAGDDLSASIGPDGVIHVLYETHDPCTQCTTPGLFISGTRYARKIAGTWQVSELDFALKEVLLVSQTRAIAGGSGGTLDVLGFGIQGTTGGLFHSHFDGSAWTHEQVLDVGIPSATDLRTVGLSRAPDGSLHGALLDPSVDGGERLYYLSKQVGGAWQTRVVKDYAGADNIQWFIGITATDGSTADILVSSHDTLDHYRVTPDAIDQFEVADAGEPFIGRITYPTLVAAPGQPLTAAFNVTANSNAGQDWYQLWVARFVGASWLAEKVYGTGMFGSGTPVPSLVDPPQLHYIDGVLHVLNKETGTPGALPGSVQPLSDWTWGPGAWQRSTVLESQATVSVIGKQIVATVDGEGQVHALHFADTLDFFSIHDGGLVMYASDAGGSPISERIPRDAGHVGGAGLAIAVAPDGTVHGLVEGGDKLMHVARTGGVWTVDDVSPPAPFDHISRSRPAMTLDDGGHVHACFYQKGFYEVAGQVLLTHVTNATGAWIQEDIVAPLGLPTGHELACDIRILGDGSIHVAYVDGAGGLRKATRAAGTWSNVLIAAQPPVEQRQQIAPLVDADGFVHASFTLLVPVGPSFVPNGIRYGSNTGVIWTEELVDDDAQLGIDIDYLFRGEIDEYSPLARSRLALATDGTVYLFYYDEGLYIARGSVRVDGAWRNFPLDLDETTGAFGDVVALPDSTARYVYAVERSGAVRATTSSPGPALFLHGDPIFPETVVGGSAMKSFTVTNHGSQDLLMETITVEADSYTVQFAGTTCGAGTTLPPGQSCTIAIEYQPAPYETQPTTSSERLGMLMIQSNDPWSPVGFRLEGLTFPAEESGGGGGGVLPLGVSAGLLLMTLLGLSRRRAAHYARDGATASRR